MISVIMSTYRETPIYIHQSIQSILDQTYRDLELILVADDPNNAVVKGLLREYEEKDPRVRVLINKENIGLPGALNRALNMVRGEFVARMDADDISHPERLEIQMQFLTENHLDLVGGSKQCIDENGTLISGTSSQYYAPDTVMKRLRFHDCLPHSSWLAKREVYYQLGGYRDMPRCEDFDFLLRAMNHGFKLGMCSQILLDYRINSNGISQSGMLEQLLASWYLSDHYGRIDYVTPEEVRKYLSIKLTPDKQMAYIRATKHFEHAVRIRKRKPLSCCVHLVWSVMESPYYRRRLATIFKLKLSDLMG